MLDEDFRKKVLLSFQRALLGEVPCTLRGVTCGWSSSEITFFCFFDGEISEEDRESMDAVAGEVNADFLDFKVSYECIRKDVPENLNKYSLKAWVYHRHE